MMKRTADLLVVLSPHALDISPEVSDYLQF